MVLAGGVRGADAQLAYDSAAVDLVKAEFAAVDDELLGSQRRPGAEDEALRRGHALVARGLDGDRAEVAAERIFRTCDLASRLPARRELLDHLADSAYAYALTDTAVAARALFTLAVGTIELNRGDFLSARLLCDSALASPPARVHDNTLAGAHMIRGYAHEGLGETEAAYDDFVAAAELFDRVDGAARRATRAIESAAGAAVRLSRAERALELSTEALRRLDALDAETALDHPEAFSAFASHAEALVALGRRDAGISAAHQALALAIGRGDELRIATSLLRLGRLHLILDELPRAEQYLTDAMRRLNGFDDPRMLASGHGTMVELRSAQRRFDEALDHQIAQHTITDSLAAATGAWRFADMRARHRDAELRHELDMARAEAALHEAARDRGRIRQAALVLLLVALGCVAALLVTRLRLGRRSERELQAKVAARTSDLEARTEQLDRQTHELRRSNTELERFAYIASHDLKTPVRNVTSFIALAERRLTGDAPDPKAVAEAREFLGIARGYAAQMAALVSDILAFSRIDAETASGFTGVDLRVLLASLERTLGERIAERGARLEVNGRATVIAPESQLEQLLGNLIVNGISYNESAVPRVMVTLRELEGERVGITVRDNGIGIDPEYHERVFELFRRLHTTEAYAGTGLGLATCRKIVERLGGSIDLDSEEGAGSTFTVVLPRDCRPAAGATQADAEVDEPRAL